jgi:hypothetical protein
MGLQPTVLQAAEVNDGGAHLVVKIKLWRHLAWVVEVNDGVAEIAEEEAAAGELFAETYLQMVKGQNGSGVVDQRAMCTHTLRVTSLSSRWVERSAVFVRGLGFCGSIVRVLVPVSSPME